MDSKPVVHIEKEKQAEGAKTQEMLQVAEKDIGVARDDKR